MMYHCKFLTQNIRWQQEFATSGLPASVHIWLSEQYHIDPTGRSIPYSEVAMALRDFLSKNMSLLSSSTMCVPHRQLAVAEYPVG